MNHGEKGSVISLPGERFELIVPPEQAPAVWQDLRSEAEPVGAPCWDWLNIRLGIPVILPETQEQFVPQMLNLDAIGGVSFQKGCYPGQEIVARTQYLGKIKRRMYLANINSNEGGREQIPLPPETSCSAPTWKVNPAAWWPTRRLLPAADLMYWR